MIIPLHYKGQTVFIFGLGIDGISAIKSFLMAGANVLVWDDNQAAREKLSEKLSSLSPECLENLRMLNPSQVIWPEISCLVLSPGVPFTHPEPADIVKLAQSANVRIICTLEILYETVKNCKFIGITGTNGKSTTTALIHHILRRCGVACKIGGNFGIPALDLEHLGADGVYVVEMSSYQLDLLDKFKCDISILLNITPDHLDRHGGMDGYVKAKKRIFKQLDGESSAIIGIDNQVSYKIYKDLLTNSSIGRIIPISAYEQTHDGVSVFDGQCYNNIGTYVDGMELGELKTLAGKHNAENIAAAVAACTLIGCSEEEIIAAIQTFEGLPHRMQYLGDVGKVTFVNDSKATNAEATSKALKTYDNIYWIAGGIAKEGGIEELKSYFPKIKHAYLIGEAQETFAAILEGAVSYDKVNVLSKAVFAAYRDAINSGEENVILLSPAAASFDQFKNFEERGTAFVELYEDIIER